MVNNVEKSKNLDIILGHGGYFVGDVCIGLTRGGGQFTVERSYRKINADGDPGGVVGRETLDESIPKLTTNLLQVINDNITKFWPAVKHTASEDGKTNTMKGTMKIEDSDFIPEVKWVGKTKKGKPIIIKVMNAINLENIDFSMQDKGEVIQKITWEGHYPADYDPVDYINGEEIEEPWEVSYPAVPLEAVEEAADDESEA